MPLPSALSYVGIAKETVKGTGVAATAFIPLTVITTHDVQSYLEDTAMRGAMVTNYGEIAGVNHSEFDLGGPVYADTIGWAVAGVLGDVTSTGSAPVTHAVAVKNSTDGQPTSYTLTDFYGYTGTHSRQYAGMQFSDLNFKFQGDGLLEWTGKASGFVSTLVAKPTQSFTTVTATPAWEGTVTIGGAGSLILESGEVDIKRPVTAIQTVDGSQAPYKMWAGPVSVDGKLTVIVEDDAELIRYLTNTQPSLSIAFAHGAGATQAGVTLYATKCAYTDGQKNLGKDYVTLDITFSCVANTTDVGASGGYSPCKVSVINQIASGTYV